MFFEGWLKENH